MPLDPNPMTTDRLRSALAEALHDADECRWRRWTLTDLAEHDVGHARTADELAAHPAVRAALDDSLDAAVRELLDALRWCMEVIEAEAEQPVHPDVERLYTKWDAALAARLREVAR